MARSNVSTPTQGSQNRYQPNNSQRIALRSHHAARPTHNQLDLERWFEGTYHQTLSAYTISRILWRRYGHLDSPISQREMNQRRPTTGRRPELEAALMEWLHRAQAQVHITQQLIREKAEQYWEALYPGRPRPSFSNEWLQIFQSQNNLHSSRVFGEAGDVNEAVAEQRMTAIREELKAYDPRDVYNCDESALFWKAIPDRSLTSSTVPGRKKTRRTPAFIFVQITTAHID